MTGSSYNNGVSENRSYSNDNTLASISHSGASIGNLSYGWDDNKNKTAETIIGTMSGYGFSVPSSGYDAEDRLVSYNRTNGNLDQSWSLSAVGDWSSVTTEGTTQARSHGAYRCGWAKCFNRHKRQYYPHFVNGSPRRHSPRVNLGYG